MAILAAVVYYGWPIIQTMIVLSPIPDPSDLHHKAQNLAKKVKGYISGGGEGERPSNVNYQPGFDNGPDTLLEDDEEDEEDVGRNFSQTKDLNYDSDEKDEFSNSE